MYQQGEIAYLEAINAATLSQAFGRMEELGLVLRKKSDSAKPIPLIAISPDYKPIYTTSPRASASAPQGSVPQEGSKLWEFLEHLSAFRREGKERREILLGERIMRHVEAAEYTIIERSKRKNGRATQEGQTKL